MQGGPHVCVRVCGRVYPKLWDCSALKWHNKVNAYNYSVPAVFSPPCSDPLQDKGALIKQRACEQNMCGWDCGDSEEPRTAKLSPTAQNTGPAVGRRNDFQTEQKPTSWKWELSNRMRRDTVVLRAQRQGEMQLLVVVHCAFRREMGRGPDGTMQSPIRVFLRSQREDLKWCLI